MISKKTKKKGFTLIEMLIVIVIIGILASAMLPKLMSARGRANDVARRADLQQIMTSLVSYQLDNQKYPTTAGGISNISGDLIAGGLSVIPKDPNNASISGIAGGIQGQYSYTTIKKNGQNDGGVVLMAAMETAGSANYVWCDTNQDISSNTTFDVVQSRMCSKVSISKTAGSCSSTTTNGPCTAYADSGNLRYIAVY